jgi:endogenous inhibitor of DNA gyrase (YacG/DUF329 family)
MFEHTPIVFCDGCGAEIAWMPVIVEHRNFCCADCAEGRPCSCGVQAEWEDERRSTSVVD